MEKKICTKCNLEKEFSEFGKMKHGKFGLRAACKLCQNEEFKQYYKNNKSSVNAKNQEWERTPKGKIAKRFYYIKKMYGLTKDEWLEMLESQNNSCKICNTYSDDLGFFHTDHDHDSGKVRGLLCKNCNTILGHAKDNIDILNNAIKYLLENPK